MNMSQCIASRDWSGARNEGIAYAMECIFGGGHGYSKGELLTEADLETGGSTYDPDTEPEVEDPIVDNIDPYIELIEKELTP
jgi:hypothetical protein